MRPLTILVAHNFYLRPGGEDVVFRNEIELLRSHGHRVVEYIDDNHRIAQGNALSIALQTIWSWETYSKILRLLKKVRPDVVHFHNTFPLISPSAYYACKKLGIPVIQTLHNYRLLCPAAILYRGEYICEKCKKNPLFLPAIRYRCFQNSSIKTVVLSLSLIVHHLLRTWQNQVSLYIALTEFSKNKFTEIGLTDGRIVVKPNFIKTNNRPVVITKEKFAVYVGRITPEKGIPTLLKAWDKLNIPLRIFGDGPLKALFETTGKNVSYMGQVGRDEINKSMQLASFMVFPSEWFEGFPMTIVEAFSFGLPVISSNIGSQAEIVTDGFSGLHFRSGDPEDLVSKVNWLWNHPDEATRMGKNARIEYEKKYAPEWNYQQLIDIYQKAIAGKAEQ